MNKANDPLERSENAHPTPMTVLALAAMWVRRRLIEEMVALDEPLSDLARDIEIGMRAVTEQAALLLGSVYGDMPTTVDEALDLLEETASGADNDLYAATHAMRGSV